MNVFRFVFDWKAGVFFVGPRVIAFLVRHAFEIVFVKKVKVDAEQ